MTALHLVTSTFTPSQSRAYQGIRQAIRTGSHRGAVLSAPAGSGKTYLTAALVGDLIRDSYEVAVTAPTNKAVGVISEKIPAAEAMTTHGLLGLRLKKTEWGGYTLEPEGRSKVSDFDVIVVDECSMLDAKLYDPLMAQARNAFLLFVGDPHQLPPPISGLERSPVFDDLRHAQFTLGEIVRQEAGSPILALATAIREHAEGRFPVECLREFTGIEVIGQEQVTSSWQTGARILAYRNATVESYNRQMHDRFFPHTQWPFCPKERVILSRQFETLPGARLHNSAEGVVTGVAEGSHPFWRDIPAWRVSLEMDDGTRASEFYPRDPREYQRLIGEAWVRWREAKKVDPQAAKALSRHAWALTDAFIPLRLGYASTVHKAQGSTFHTAIVDVRDLSAIKAHREFNKLLYTAVTRPSDRLILAM
ncbi:AAA family ATPase [Acidithiobacillus caldus]|uniref:ATP-dependent DNA helicase n=1 Tax=Acidithiobacillus caldus TaxID=33059 RepID=UPI001C07979E|nr:AAA family ATPase [Acidithiobacillus caldus]MBU2803224.1 AAA family ATPase [Acidithiobacillus caldus]